MSVVLKLYVKVWCPWCISAQRYLSERRFLFEQIDVQRVPGAYEEMIRISGQSFTPTLVAGDRVLADFGTDELDDFLKQHSIEANAG